MSRFPTPMVALPPTKRICLTHAATWTISFVVLKWQSVLWTSSCIASSAPWNG